MKKQNAVVKRSVDKKESKTLKVVKLKLKFVVDVDVDDEVPSLSSSSSFASSAAFGFLTF